MQETTGLLSVAAVTLAVIGYRRAERGSDALTRTILFAAYVLAGAGFVLWLLTILL